MSATSRHVETSTEEVTPPGETQSEAIGQTNALTRSLRTLGSQSLTYAFADIMVRAAAILLVPLYTRAMTPKAYGILAVTTSVSFFMTTLLNLSLDSAITRQTLELDADRQRSLYGSILAFMFIGPPAALGALELAGQAGALDFFKNVPYSPYLRYALWAAYLTAFMYLPCGMWIARGKPRLVLRLKFVNTAVQVVAGITLIVVLHEGAIGALRALLIASGITAIISASIMIKNSSRALQRRLFVSALAFSLPVIPHLMAHWALQLSDRVILQRYVSSAQLGLYSLGYTAGLVASIVTTNFANAAMPIIVARLKAKDPKHEVPALGTYSLLVLTGLCVAMGVFGGTAVTLFTPASYHGAAKIVPWVVASYVFVSMYMLLAQGTWFVMRTGWIAAATCGAAAVNLVLTYLLAARMGILGAAVATLLGYAVLALFHGIVAYRLYRIRWEYGRWSQIVVFGLASIALGSMIGNQLSLTSFLLRAAVVVGLFPCLLVMTGFLRRDERRWLLQIIAARRMIRLRRAITRTPKIDGEWSPRS